MVKTEDNESVKSEITVKFIGKQINRRTVEENHREIVKKTLSYNLPKGLTEYLHPYEDVNYWETPTDDKSMDYYHKNDYMWSDDETINSFTKSSINLIDDTPIELWENDSISENLLLDFTDKNGETQYHF
ncbi:22920_t:CDS:2 [Dentiscutata erythropus]|uniref:22920_t:CDS:1 n=1 Tax=Dentiscutata erythropus TaxID=1348616 RepID=A0A9N9CEE6_9GLOM|nr:22920_t:CDS:2 [Dentiscutata erythropus]